MGNIWICNECFNVFDRNLDRSWFKMSKVWGIQEGDFFKLVNLMNEFNSKNRVYATQVFQRGIEWFALIYYDEQGKDKGKPYSQPPSPDSNINNEVPAT